jgi:uncharacterized membrane protein
LNLSLHSLIINWTALAGHFHPVLVHLPIGILILACIFMYFSLVKKITGLEKAVSIALFWGMISAAASCASGYLLSLSGDYDQSLVSLHQWMGISVLAISALFYFLQRRRPSPLYLGGMSVLLFLLITITGHLGGTLTHGEGYLTGPLYDTTGSPGTEVPPKPIPNVQEALAYQDIIQPLLRSKCYGCHGSTKQKGGLRLDLPDAILRGGKDGVVLNAALPDQSILVKRILLPREEEKHMPPKEKPQFSSQELSLLHWWVATGASFDKKVRQLEQPGPVKPALLALQHKPVTVTVSEDLPAEPVVAADEKALKSLRDLGVVILPLAGGTNYLQANFVPAPGIKDKDLSLLLPLSRQLVSLKIEGVPIGDSAMARIGQCTSLRRLQLSHTSITAKGLVQLKGLRELRVLNLVGNSLSASAIAELRGLPKLHSLYLYQTGIRGSDWESLKKYFPSAKLDSGGYQVPTLAADTSQVKAPKKP